jgi:hypothetical protein
MSGEQVTSALQTAHKFDLGIIACGVLMLIFSFLPYYTAELNGFGLSISDSASAWHGFFGWFGAVVALAVAVLVSLHIGGLRLSMPTRLVALVGFAISLVCVVLALFIIPGGDCNGIQACEDAIDFGHGIGYWLSVITVVIGLVLAFLRKDATD